MRFRNSSTAGPRCPAKCHHPTGPLTHYRFHRITPPAYAARLVPCVSRCPLLGANHRLKVRDEASWYKTNKSKPTILDQNPTRLERKLRLTIISLQRETRHCVLCRPIRPGYEILCEIRHALLNLQLPLESARCLGLCFTNLPVVLFSKARNRLPAKRDS